jgi:hypothetical protein
MALKNALLSALFAAAIIGTVTLPLNNTAAADTYVNRAPPAPRYEAVPGPRVGYVWAPGHWQWDGGRNRYYWGAGTWERSRPGYVMHGAEWVQRGGRWHYQARYWEQGRGRDTDRDGIPDRRDATPYGGQMPADRDRDGVPDHRDDRPSDPTRR